MTPTQTQTPRTSTFYQCGFRSGAGFPVRYDMTYTLEGAKAKAKELGHGTRVFEVTVTEVV